MPTVLSNQSARSTNEAFLNVQSDVLQPLSIIKDDDKPIVPQGYGDNKAIPKVYKFPSPLTMCKRIQATSEDPAESVNQPENILTMFQWLRTLLAHGLRNHLKTFS